MSILNDREITELCCGSEPMITPFVNKSIKKNDVGNGILSYGLSSFGYDVRLAPEAKIFSNLNGDMIDPKRLKPTCLVDCDIRTDEYGDDYVIIPPNSYMLGVTAEYFNIPRDIMVVCLGKSTLARAGALVNTTPIEPGFKGQVVIEIGNLSTLPLKIYIHEGIAQFLFFRGLPCEVSYGDRNGKYQNQTSITLPRT